MINVQKYIEIEKRRIGPEYPPYVVAELSANHNGKLDRALETLVMAKEMGADAVKLQTYSPDTMTIDCDNEDFQIKGGFGTDIISINFMNGPKRLLSGTRPYLQRPVKLG